VERACDVHDLCVVAGLDPEQYFTFAPDDAAEVAEPLFAFPRPSAAASAAPRVDPAPQVKRVAVALPLPPQPAAAPVFAEVPAALFEAPAAPAVRRRVRPQARLASSRRYPGIAFRAAAGGCGATTVAATVARILAAGGEHIVLGDGSSLPMLPAHFGATHLSRGTWSLLPGRRRQAGAVHVLSNADPAGGAGFADGWLGAELSAFPHPWNRMVLDISSSAAADLEGLAGIDLRVVIVVHPSPAARMRLPVLLEEYAELGIRPYVLLNRFNADKAAHTDLRRQLRASLGSALMPFEIRTSDEVPGALEDGLTVDESAPDHAVTGDFRLLAGWVQASAGATEMIAAARQGDAQ
jgi:MinD-like ATPase involved in chromosome partitioning or flagellar assembly